MNHTEHLDVDGTRYGIVIRADHRPDKTTFYTLPTTNQQVGHIIYPAGGRVPRHYHKQLDRHIKGTTEVLLVQSGRCVVTFYDGDQTPVIARELRAGDLLLIHAKEGQGHGFEMFDDTVMLEIKQGPYVGPDEKVYF